MTVRNTTATVLLVAALSALAILNCGGYLYGASDQAFYVPALLRQIDPSLFPRDRILLDAQDRLMAVNWLMGALVRATGISVPVLLLVGYLAGMVALFAGSIRVGRLFFASSWSTAAFGLALTLRHRISRTGANTLEAYFQPRMLAFAVGMFAVAAILRRRHLTALALVAVAALLHPTTALWFGLWAGVAALVDGSASLRRGLALGAVAGVAAAGWAVLVGPLAGRLGRMDEAWVATLATKDYIFPHQWPWWAWGVNLLYPLVIVALFRARRRADAVAPGERGLVVGAVALATTFLLAVPLIEARVALAVQLQVSRLFWMLDVAATAYVIWLIGEWRPALDLSKDDARREPPGGSRKPGAWGAWPRPALVCALLAVASLGRGTYTKWVDHPERAVVQMRLPAGDWNEAMEWLAHQPVGVHVLADPGHAWRYGSSVRLAAGRDLFLEEVKDVALAMYSREVAMRVRERLAEGVDLATITPGRALALAAKYDLDYLVTDRPIDLPVAFTAGRFTIHELWR